MNLLFLLDLAPGYHRLLAAVGEAAKRQGHSVFFAVDSPQNLARFSEYPVNGELRVFSEAFAAVPDGEGFDDFAWTGFFPDYDRYEVFGVNRGRTQDWYRRLGRALDAFFTGCLSDWKIDAVVYEGVTNSFAWFARRAADRHGAEYLALQASRLPGRHEVNPGGEREVGRRIAETYRRLREGESEGAEVSAWVDRYLENFRSATPDYMKSNGLLLENPVSKYAKREHLKTFGRLSHYQLTRRSEAEQSYRSGRPLAYSLTNVRRNVMRWLRAPRIRPLYSSPGSGDEFYLYPLHFHPEASTSMLARWYVDEYPVIKNLAFSLKPGRWLYVKDHPSAVGYPDLEFYRRVADIPNVKLITPDADTKSLITDSLGVMTQTSTVGYEALVLGRPVWTLGKVFYDFHEGCSSIGWTDDLEERLDRIPNPRPDAGRMLVAAHFLHTLPGSLPLQGEAPGTATFEDLARELVEELETRRRS